MRYYYKTYLKMLQNGEFNYVSNSLSFIMHAFLYLDIRTIYTSEELDSLIEAFRNHIEHQFDHPFVLLKNFKYAKNAMDEEELKQVYNLVKELDDDVFKYLSSVLLNEEEMDIDMLVSEGIIKDGEGELGVDVVQVFYFFFSSLNKPGFQNKIFDSQTEITSIFERDNVLDFTTFIKEYDIDLSDSSNILVEVIVFEIVRFDAYQCYLEYSKTGVNPLAFMEEDNRNRLLINLFRTTKPAFFEEVIKGLNTEISTEVKSYLFFSKTEDMFAYFAEYFSLSHISVMEAIEYINMYLIPQENLSYILKSDAFLKEEDIDGYTVLEVILELGEVPVVKEIMELGYDITKRIIVDKHGNYRTIYYRTLFNPHIEVFKEVMRYVNQKRKMITEHLYYDALFNGLLPQALFLKEEDFVTGEYVEDDRSYRIIRHAVHQNDFDVFQFMMATYYKNSPIPRYEYDLLYDVIQANNAPMVELLLKEYGFNPNQMIVKKHALTYAIDRSHMKIAELLVEYGAHCKTKWYQPLVYKYYERDQLKKDYPELYKAIKERMTKRELIRGYTRNGILFVAAWILFSIFAYYFILS